MVCQGIPRRLFLVLALAAALVSVGGAARAAAAGPALGVLGDPDRFDRLTGQRTTTRLLIVGWAQGTSARYFTRLFETMRELPMVGLSTGSEGAPETITPARIAAGGGDALLLALNQAIAAWGKPILVRPLAEMNGHWNAYCAYEASGRARGPDHSTAAFRKAFARIYLVLHGGAAVNARLRALGEPPVRGAPVATRGLEVIWNPQGYGAPDVAGNSAQAYYPGDAYVDMVGDDLYDIRGKAEWDAAEALYRAHPGKPFSFPEWGLWGLDDPTFVERMAGFVRSHPRLRVLGYYSGSPGSVFDLSSKPRSLARYRRLIATLR